MGMNGYDLLVLVSYSQDGIVGKESGKFQTLERHLVAHS